MGRAVGAGSLIEGPGVWTLDKATTQQGLHVFAALPTTSRIAIEKSLSMCAVIHTQRYENVYP